MTSFPSAKLLSACYFVLFCSCSCTSTSARASRCHPSGEEEIRQRKFEEGQKEIGFIVPAVHGVWQLQGQSRQRPASCTPQWSPAQREKGQLPLDRRRQADVSAAIYANARLGTDIHLSASTLKSAKCQTLSWFRCLARCDDAERLVVLQLREYSSSPSTWRKVSHRFRNARHEESCSSCRLT